MALFPFYRYHLFNDPFFFYDLDFFDPWFDIGVFPPFFPITPQFRRFEHQERLTYSKTHTTNSPNSLEQAPPVSPPEKFRVQLDVDGFNPDTLNKRIEGRKLIVEGKQEDRREERNYTNRQMRETFELPQHADPNGLTSHVSPNNKLVIEVPIRTPPANRRLEPVRNDHQSLTQFDQYRDPLLNNAGSLDNSNLQPRIVNKGNNQKQLEVTVGVKNFRPEELQVLVKNNELIVQGEHQHKDDNRSERSFFFKSTTLPPGTQIEQLQAHLNDDGQLRIEGPVL